MTAASVIRSSMGLVHAVSAGLDPEGFFRRRAARTDPTVVTFPGLGEVLFFGTKQAARDILTIPAAVCRAPSPNPIEPIVGEGSLILLSGEEHRRERALLMPAFHGERMRAYLGTVAETTAEQIRSLRPGDRIAVRELALGIALQVIIRVVFGVADRHRQGEYAHAVKDLLRANSAPLMLMPALRRDIAGRGPWGRLLKLRAHLDHLLAEDMDHHRGSGFRRADVRDALLSATNDQDRRHGQPRLYDQLRTLLAAGHETSATSLTWTLYHIYRDDVVRERLGAELSECPSPEYLPALPYLGAVIKETLRMHPVVPIVLRRLAGPLTIGGVWCSRGDTVGIALYALHFDPSMWPDPDRFDPERFLGTDLSPFEYAPFGGGSRRCIGASFALCELAVAIGTILRTVELRMPPMERSRRPPRVVPRGIATVPDREITLEVLDRHAAA
ncbi:MAG: cytochrome [Mycobacterium sp.]|jgi:cytochrome P450|uniref:cytochrome P450 n=1 Tax=Mycobacterium sp. TaxID=1785 RepID=UPI00262B0A22|nr:cytochrome P450 [Mycobacterium sp.]MCW2660365.1 cytochrome [Mycobacterium sp.]